MPRASARRRGLVEAMASHPETAKSPAWTSAIVPAGVLAVIAIAAWGNSRPSSGIAEKDHGLVVAEFVAKLIQTGFDLGKVSFSYDGATHAMVAHWSPDLVILPRGLRLNLARDIWTAWQHHTDRLIPMRIVDHRGIEIGGSRFGGGDAWVED